MEINGSFYSLLKPDTYRRWYEATPSGFVFAVKGSRFITHAKKLRDVETPLANFLASGILTLEEKLGPILWQLPQDFALEPDRLDAFLGLLPHDTEGAARLAAKHDRRVEGRSCTRTGRRRRLRHALEVRREDSLTPETARIARRHGTALVVSDAADWPRREELTAGWVYVRLHGSKRTYASRYRDEELDRWAHRIREWRRGRQPGDATTLTGRKPPPRKERDVYVYFDNDDRAHAPKDALRLAERLGATPSR
jgi:uncharacterized protein YecE (DUF72 family)